MALLFDMHCHLDFLDAEAAHGLAGEAALRGIGAFSCTVTPSGYADARRALEGCANVRVGVGMHPWWVADGRIDAADIEAFESLAAQEKFIGEVGLDFAPRHAHARERQIAAFSRALDACGLGGKVLSIHAVRSASVVLDMLEARGACANNACILHWFSGSSDELARAVRQGCYFSVGVRMFASKRGRAYARAIPRERLLLETDEPGEGAPYSAAAWEADIHDALAAMAEARGEDAQDLGDCVAHTSAALLRL